jgi:hypothetical protein
MSEGKKMAEEANRMSREAQEGARRIGKELQTTAESGLRQQVARSVKSTGDSRRWLPR